MKARRCHVDVEHDYKEVEKCQWYKGYQDELPPVFMSIWTLDTTEVVGEY